MSEEKKCTKCKKIKPYSDFSTQKSSVDGLKPWCRNCTSNYNKIYREKNREKLNKYLNEYYQSNKEPLKKEARERHYLNRDKNIKKNKEYYYRNKDVINKKRRDFARDNKEIVNKKARESYYRNQQANLIRAKEYRNSHKEEIRIKKNKYEKEKMSNDIDFRILKLTRKRIRNAIRNTTSKACTSSVRLLGCTIENARKHIENLFIDGMNWEMFMTGEIHIDHIKPCALFDLTDPEEQKKCFHYTNLQPLWWRDNISKGAKYYE